ncbi:MAG: hypothetical protein JWN14_3966 [Chthonomonadales bacterium]|nr:hypothetical protein [Chthonomonadales bacterium]
MMGFFLSYLASLLSNITIYSVPLLIALFYMRPLLRFWGMRCWPASRVPYMIVIGSGTDERNHNFTPDTERHATEAIRDHFQSLLVRFFGGAGIPSSCLSCKVEPREMKNKNLILIGGPVFNTHTKNALDKLKAYGLFFSFVESAQGWEIQNTADRVYDSSYTDSNKDLTGHHYDHGILVRAPNPDDEATVLFILAGIHGEGTKAAVDIGLKRNLALKVYEQLREQKIKSPFYAAVIRVSIHDAIINDIQVISVCSINAHSERLDPPLTGGGRQITGTNINAQTAPQGPNSINRNEKSKANRENVKSSNSGSAPTNVSRSEGK